MESKYHGVKVAAYPYTPFRMEKLKVTDFYLKGHAVAKPVPSEMTFEEFLEVSDGEGVTSLGKRSNGIWVIVIENPMTNEKCTWGRSPDLVLDIVP